MTERLDSAIVCLNGTVVELDRGARTEPNFRHREEGTGLALGLPGRTQTETVDGET